MIDRNQYEKEYSDESLFNKIKSVCSKAGVNIIYGVWLLFYSLKDESVPMKAKITIIGALGHFIAPIDLIADPIPIVGYGDDLAAIITALGVISIFITPEIKRRARKRTKEWFSNVTENDFNQMEKIL